MYKRCVSSAILAISFAAALAACDTRTQMRRMAAQAKEEMEPFFDHAEHHPVMIGSRVISEAEFLGRPRRLAAVGNYLVVSDMVSEHAVHVFDRGSHEYIGSFGRHGRGPGEFIAAPALSAVPGASDLVLALDPSFRRASLFRLPKGGVVPFDERGIVRLPTAFVYALEMIDQRRAMGLGFFEHGRLGLFDLAAETVEYAGALPAEHRDEHYVRLQQAYQGFLALNPARTRAVVATRLSSDVEIYDTAGALLARGQAPYPFGVDYMVDEDGEFMAGPRTRFGYQSVAATDSLIYALFSGRAEAHYRGVRGGHAEFVHLFGWDGSLRGVLRLDREVLAIAVDPAATELYAVTENPQPAVLVFPLD